MLMMVVCIEDGDHVGVEAFVYGLEQLSIVGAVSFDRGGIGAFVGPWQIYSLFQRSSDVMRDVTWVAWCDVSSRVV